MCYTIEGNNSGLVIVDGGYKDDEETSNLLNNGSIILNYMEMKNQYYFVEMLNLI